VTVAAATTPDESASPPIVVVSTTRGGGWGGRTSLLELAEGLGRLGRDVSLLTVEPEMADAWRSATGRTARVMKVPRARGAAVGRNSKARRFMAAMAVASQIAKIPRQATVIVFDHDALCASAMVALAKPWARRRVFLDVHFPAHRWRARARAWGRHLTGAICVSAFSAEPFEGICPTHVVWRPITDVIAPRSVDNGQLVSVALLGRVDRVKHPDMGVRAVAELADPDVRLIMRGAGYMDSDDYLASVCSLGENLLGDQFAFEGRVPRERTLDDVDVLLHCNPHEAFGRTVAESQVAGRIVVVPDEGGSAEFVRDGLTGFKYDFTSASSLQAALRKAVDAARVDPEIGRRAREFALAEFDAVALSRRYLEVLES